MKLKNIAKAIFTDEDLIQLGRKPGEQGKLFREVGIGLAISIAASSVIGCGVVFAVERQKASAHATVENRIGRVDPTVQNRAGCAPSPVPAFE